MRMDVALQRLLASLGAQCAIFALSIPEMKYAWRVSLYAINEYISI